MRKSKNYCLITIVILTIIVTIVAVYWFLTSFLLPARLNGPKQTVKDGRLAMFINKYYKTLKCLANIIDDYTESKIFIAIYNFFLIFCFLRFGSNNVLLPV